MLRCFHLFCVCLYLFADRQQRKMPPTGLGLDSVLSCLGVGLGPTPSKSWYWLSVNTLWILFRVTLINYTAGKAECVSFSYKTMHGCVQK